MARDAAFTASTMQVAVRGRVEIPGPEDIAIDHAAGIAFVASQQRLSATGKILNPEEMPGGAIFGLDLNRDPLVPRRLIQQETLGVPFHPRGCSLYCGAPGERRLLVISDRAAADHVVEVFDVDGGPLQHVRTVADPEHLISPNDLVALDGDQFYVAIDHGARSVNDLFLDLGYPAAILVIEDECGCRTLGILTKITLFMMGCLTSFYDITLATMGATHRNKNPS